MKIIRCKTNQKYNPIGFLLKTESNPMGNPFLSWEVVDAKSHFAKCVQIIVSKKIDFTEIVYDSGTMDGYPKNCMRILLKPEPYTRYYWKVIVSTEQDGIVESDVQFFETGKGEDRWQASWIGCPELETENPVFSQDMVAEKEKNVRFYICGLGIYELYVNGQRCGEEYFAPGCNEYDKWLQYQTYELKLKQGNNHIQVSLGNGWYRGRFGLLGGKQLYGDQFALIGELWDMDTHELLVKTDETWKVEKGATVQNNFYDGEEQWESKRSGEQYSATVMTDLDEKKKTILTERLSLPVKIHEVFKPSAVIKTPKGETVIDFGQNMAGFVRFRADEDLDTVIHLQYGEVLQDGCFYRENLRSAKAEFIYHGTGKKETVQPHFTYYGFRYVKIEGLTKPFDEYEFEACALYSDLEQTGIMTTGNEKVNQLISNIAWGQKSNYVDIPTDCPQRDERLGWTGDTQVFAGAACFMRNSYSFLDKFCKDLYETQKKLGCIPNTIPAFDDKQPSCAAWADAAVIIPWTLYQFYGNEQILADQYESMKMWVDSVDEEVNKTNEHHIWKPSFGYGDWLARDHDNPSERMLGGTELAYVSTAYYYYSTSLVAKAAKVLKKVDWEKYEKRSLEIKQDFLNEYYSPTGRLAVNTQTAYILALYMGLYPEGKEERVARELHEKLENCQVYLKTGFVGTAYIMKVLSKYGYHEDACTLLLNEGVPSWLYAVNLGATTLWERWDSLLPDGKVNGTDMNSLNHYASGAVIEWMYQYLAGICPVEEYPGFSHIECRPNPCRALKTMCCKYDSAAGTYRVEWEFLPEKKMKVKVAVPFGATASLDLPYSDMKYELEAGEYTYIYRRENDGTEHINTFMPFSALRKVEEVKPILQELFPGYEGIPETFAKESIRSLAKLPYFDIQEDTLDEIDSRIIDVFEK